jgi:hypothetical protein
MRTRLVLGGLIATLCIAPAAAWAGSGMVGLRPTSQTVVVANGQFFGELARIAVFDGSHGLCIKTFQGPDPATDVTCGTTALPKDGKALEIDGFSGESSINEKKTFTNVAGSLRPDVASVSVRFHRHGQRRIVTALSGQLSADGAATVHKPQFGRFLAVLGGCIPGREIKVVALAADGTILGSQRAFRTPGFCHPFHFSPAIGPPPEISHPNG